MGAGSWRWLTPRELIPMLAIEHPLFFEFALWERRTTLQGGGTAVEVSTVPGTRSCFWLGRAAEQRAQAATGAEEEEEEEEDEVQKFAYGTSRALSRFVAGCPGARLTSSRTNPIGASAHIFVFSVLLRTRTRRTSPGDEFFNWNKDTLYATKRRREEEDR